MKNTNILKITQQRVEEMVKEFREKFCFCEKLVCADCGHERESHYWNGGGRAENAGYDACRVDGCECTSKNWAIKKVEFINEEQENWLRAALQKAREWEIERIREEIARELKQITHSS